MKSCPTNANIKLCLSPQRKDFEEHSSHLPAESFDLLLCTLKFLQVVRGASEEQTQPHTQLHTGEELHPMYRSRCAGQHEDAKPSTGKSLFA